MQESECRSEIVNFFSYFWILTFLLLTSFCILDSDVCIRIRSDIGTSSSSTLITFAALPPCLPIYSQRTRLEIVKRLYTIGRIKGGMKFTCTHCAHHVSTLDFDSRDGNLRTQAATAINQHATKVHHEPVMFSSLDTQQHIWRA
jgi:hypothetical protein